MDESQVDSESDDDDDDGSSSDDSPEAPYSKMAPQRGLEKRPSGQGKGGGGLQSKLKGFLGFGGGGVGKK